MEDSQTRHTYHGCCFKPILAFVPEISYTERQWCEEVEGSAEECLPDAQVPQESEDPRHEGHHGPVEHRVPHVAPGLVVIDVHVQQLKRNEMGWIALDLIE